MTGFCGKPRPEAAKRGMSRKKKELVGRNSCFHERLAFSTSYDVYFTLSQSWMVIVCWTIQPSAIHLISSEMRCCSCCSHYGGYPCLQCIHSTRGRFEGKHHHSYSGFSTPIKGHKDSSNRKHVASPNTVPFNTGRSDKSKIRKKAQDIVLVVE